MQKFLLTQTLLSSWLWSYKLDTGYDDFLRTLRRERTPQTKAMLEGIRFENVLNATLNGAEIDATHEWYKPITELVGVLTGAQQQVKLYRDIKVEGISFLCHGVLDFLKAGTVFDTKFSKTYSVGKYLDSPQAPMYLFLVPEARKFQYKVCDGTYIYTETYRPDEVEPIERTIANFMRFLEKMSLIDVFKSHWKARY